MISLFIQSIDSTNIIDGDVVDDSSSGDEASNIPDSHALSTKAKPDITLGFFEADNDDIHESRHIRTSHGGIFEEDDSDIDGDVRMNTPAKMSQVSTGPSRGARLSIELKGSTLGNRYIF